MISMISLLDLFLVTLQATSFNRALLPVRSWNQYLLPLPFPGPNKNLRHFWAYHFERDVESLGADMPTVCVKPVSQNESYVLLLVSRFLRACHGTACWTPARFFRCDADSIKCRVAMFLCFKMSLGDVEPPWSLCFGQALVHSGLRPDRQHRMYFEKSSQQCCPSLPGTHLS